MSQSLRSVFVLFILGFSFLSHQSVQASESALLSLFEQLAKRGIVVSHSNLQGAGDSATFDEIKLSSNKDNAPQFVFSSGTVTKAKASDGVGLDGETFTAKKLRIVSGDQSIAFANFQVQDFSFPHMEILLDAPVATDPLINQVDPLGVLNGTFYKFLAGISFSLFGVDSAEVLAIVEDVKASVSSGPVALEQMQGGILASYAVNNIDYKINVVQGQDISFSIEKVLVSDYNLKTLAHVLGDDNYKDGKGDGVWREAIGVGTVTNMEMLIDGGTFKIAKMSTGVSRLRQLDISPLEAMKAMQSVAEAQQKGGNQIELFRDFLPALSSLYRMMEIDEMRLEGMVVSPPKAAAPFKLGTVLIDRFSLDQGLKEVSIADLAFTDKNGTAVNLGRFALGDIQFPALVDIMSYLEGLSGDNPPELNYAAVASVSPTLGEIDVKNLDAVFGNDNRFNVEGATLSASHYIGLVPTNLSLKLDNVTVPLEGLSRSNGTADILFKMGYQQAVLNGTIDMAWIEATQELVILPSQIRINDLGILNLSAKMGNVPRQFVEDPQEAAALALGATFKEIEVSFEDQSFTNRFIEKTAKESGGAAATVRQQFSAIAKGPLAIFQRPEFAEMVGTVVDNFLANPGKITVTAKPLEPIALVGFAVMAQQAPGNVIDALNIEVSGP